MAETSRTDEASPPVEYEYIWFGGRPVAQEDVATGTTHWTFTDHLGTPIVQTDAAGAVDWRAEYEPYGQVYALRAGAGRHQPLSKLAARPEDGMAAHRVEGDVAENLEQVRLLVDEEAVEAPLEDVTAAFVPPVHVLRVTGS